MEFHRSAQVINECELQRQKGFVFSCRSGKIQLASEAKFVGSGFSKWRVLVSRSVSLLSIFGHS